MTAPLKVDATSHANAARRPILKSIGETRARPGNGQPSGEPQGGHAAERDALLGALSLLLGLHGIERSDDAIAAGLPINGKLTAEMLPRVAAANGCSAQRDRRKLDAIPDLALPVILELKNGNACVLVRRISAKRAVVRVPYTTKQAFEIDVERLRGLYAGACYFVKPELKADERTGVDIPVSASSWFWGTIWRYRGYYQEAALAALLINVLALAGSFFAMNVYDRVITNQAYVTLWTLAIGVCIAMGFEFLARTLRGWVLDHAGKKIDLVLGASLFRQALATRLEHRPVSSGAFAANLKEFESVRDFATSATLVSLTDIPFLFLFLWVIALVAGPLFWVPALAIPVVLFVTAIAQFPLARYINENLRESALKHGLLIEAVEGAETIKALRAEGQMQAKYEISAALTARTSMKSRLASHLVINFTYLAQGMVTVVMIVWGVYLIGEGKLTMGALIAAVMLAGRALMPVGSLTSLAVRFQQARSALRTLNNVMRMPTDRGASEPYLSKTRFSGELNVRSLAFSYGQELPNALDGLDIAIQAGERVAVLGRVGSGKSTLLKVLSGLYRPSTGAVSVDGVDIHQYDPVDVRRHIVYCGQDVRLFYGTLRENLKAGNTSVDDEKMVHIAKLVGVHRFAAEHPRGYDMLIGERGEGLSGGQRQAIALARALLIDPAVILLDEPTSAMDPASEHQALQAVQELCAEKTIVIVTHKLQLLQFVARVIILDAGKRVADGPRAQVMRAVAEGRVRGGRAGSATA